MTPAIARVRGHLGAARRRFREWQFERSLAGPRLLRAFAAQHERPFFIEIGANDGEQHDHLRPFILASGWTGIMVEPVPYIFARLERNYQSVPGVVLENAAIGERDGTTPFYHLVDATPEERGRLPDWYDGIGSFSRAAVLSHEPQIPDVADRTVRADVRVLTFESLCRRHGVESVDLIVIDTEGHDWNVIQTIDLERRAPGLLVYEHFHLQAAERGECRRHLESHGYRTMEEGFDTFCLHRDASRALQSAFDRLTPAIAGVSKFDEPA